MYQYNRKFERFFFHLLPDSICQAECPKTVPQCCWSWISSNDIQSIYCSGKVSRQLLCEPKSENSHALGENKDHQKTYNLFLHILTLHSLKFIRWNLLTSQMAEIWSFKCLQIGFWKWHLSLLIWFYTHCNSQYCVLDIMTANFKFAALSCDK